MNFEVDTHSAAKPRHGCIALGGLSCTGARWLGLLSVFAWLGLSTACNTLASLNERSEDASVDVGVDEVDTGSPCTTDTQCLYGTCNKKAGSCECANYAADLDDKLGCEFGLSAMSWVTASELKPSGTWMPSIVSTSQEVAVVGDFGGLNSQSLCILPINDTGKIDGSCYRKEGLGFLGSGTVTDDDTHITLSVFRGESKQVFGMATKNGVRFANYTNDMLTLTPLVNRDYHSPLVSLPQIRYPDAEAEFVTLNSGGSLVWLALGQQACPDEPCVVATGPDPGTLFTLSAFDRKTGTTIGLIYSDGFDHATVLPMNVSSGNYQFGTGLLLTDLDSAIYTDSIFHEVSAGVEFFIYVANNSVIIRNINTDSLSAEPVLNSNMGVVYEMEMLGEVLLIASVGGLYAVDLGYLQTKNTLVNIASYEDIGSQAILGMSADETGLVIMSGDRKLRRFVSRVD